MTKELEPVDHSVEGLKNILSKYKDDEKLKVLINTFLLKINELEDEFVKFKTQLSLGTAMGANLTLIGDILNARSRKVDDEEYRKLLYALVTAYNSNGTASDMFNMFQKIIEAETIYVEDIGGGNFRIDLINPTLPIDSSFIYEAIDVAKSAGVGYLPITLVPPNYFAFSNDPSGGGFSTYALLTYSFDFYSGGNGFSERILTNFTGGERVIQFNTTDASASSFLAELTSAFSAAGGSLEIVDRNGVVFTFTALGPTNISDAYGVSTRHYIQIDLTSGGNTANTCTVTKNGTPVTDMGALGFATYFEPDVSIFDANNPNGMPGVLINDSEAGNYSTLLTND
jgi:hypothetical protein